MRVGIFPLLLFCFFAFGISRAQAAPPTPLEDKPTISLRQTTPTVEQQPSPAGSQTPEEAHPRLFWVFPTYTVADIRSHYALTAHGKWRLFVKNTTDPFTVGWVAFDAGIAQANDDSPDYGQGAAGYGKRFGAGLADEAAGGFFRTFFFPSILHQDPRYYRLGNGPYKKRLGHALIRTVLTHNDSGGRAFNWSGILGSLATSGISNAYYPEANRGVSDTFSRVARSIPFSMIDELFNEFGPDLQQKIFGKK